MNGRSLTDCVFCTAITHSRTTGTSDLPAFVDESINAKRPIHVSRVQSQCHNLGIEQVLQPAHTLFIWMVAFY